MILILCGILLAFVLIGIGLYLLLAGILRLLFGDREGNPRR